MSWFDLVYAFGPLAISAIGIVVSLTLGGLLQRRHLADIARRHAALAGIAVGNNRRFDAAGSDGQLVVGEAVISAGYLRSLLAKLKKLIGGELRSYHVIMFRAREEATLRMLEQAHAAGLDAVANVRIETADLSASTYNTRTRAAYVAVVASGTGYRRR